MNPEIKKTFTLIELLIVVAIIGILLSLLLPSLQKAREATKRAVCLSNLSQQTKIITTFGIGFNQKIPLQHYTHEPRNSAYIKVNNAYINSGTLYKADMLKDANLLRCPSGPSVYPYLTDQISMSDVKDHQVVLSDYSTRPVKHKTSAEVDDKLSYLINYAGKAILSEHLYARYSNYSFHGNGNAVAYGDGHVSYIWDKSGSKFLSRAKTGRSTNLYYQANSDGELSSGLWWELDERF